MNTLTFHPSFTGNMHGEYRACVMLRTSRGRMAGCKTSLALYASKQEATLAARVACYAVAPALRRDYPNHDISVAP